VSARSTNTETVLASVDAFNRGDLETLLAALHPDIEWHVPPVLPEGPVYHGHAGVRDVWRSLNEPFDAFQIDVEEVLEAGDRVLVMAAVRGRGRESGVEVDTPSFGWIWTLEDGLVVRVEVHPRRALALEALGLEP
jgi:ketosteroid isomerase-like protein